jgi:hypothetical protein
MDERQIAKDALKIEYQKEIASQLVKELNLSSDAITVSEKGEIQFSISSRLNPDPVYGLVRSLMVELGNTKAELWLLTHSNKEQLELLRSTFKG